jgi:hypothetical protein
VSGFSTSNITNSLGRALGDRLLTLGYLVYWHEIDAVQTPALWYHAYSVQQASYLADPTFAAAVASAKGLITVRADISALPRFVTRHTVDGTVPGQDMVPVPAISLEVEAALPLRNVEIGTATLKWRQRPIMLIALARDVQEQRRLTDELAQLFDEDAEFAIADHDAGSQAPVGSARLSQVAATRATALDDAEALTFQVLVNAFLEYVA